MVLLLNLESVFLTLADLGFTQRTYKVLMPGQAPDQLPRISGMGPGVCILGLPRWLQVWPKVQASVWQGQGELHNPEGGSLLGQACVTKVLQLLVTHVPFPPPPHSPHRSHFITPCSCSPALRFPAVDKPAALGSCPRGLRLIYDQPTSGHQWTGAALAPPSRVTNWQGGREVGVGQRAEREQVPWRSPSSRPLLGNHLRVAGSPVALGRINVLAHYWAFFPPRAVSAASEGWAAHVWGQVTKRTGCPAWQRG